MAEDKSPPKDLFGDPIRPRREGRGRPEHVWTVENSNKINLIFATGGEIADAAAVLGITQPTLRKHYFSELEQWRVAKLRLKASLLAKLFEEGEKGNVGAIKEIFRQLELGTVQAAARSIANRGAASSAPKRERSEPIGKKEALKAAAGEVKGKFAPPTAPTLPGVTKH